MKRVTIKQGGQLARPVTEEERYSMVALLMLAVRDSMRALGRISPAALVSVVKQEVPGAFNTRTDEIEEQ